MGSVSIEVAAQSAAKRLSTEADNRSIRVPEEARTWGLSGDDGMAKSPLPIREPEFAKRVNLACQSNPHIPEPNRGQHVWVASEFKKRFDVTVSREGVRRWFTGINKPEGEKMSQLAEILGVDVAWLAFGQTPAGTPTEQRARNAMASGAVNLVAGLIQMEGGTVAFPETDDANGPDIFAIIRGGRYDLNVVLLRQDRPEEYRAFVPVSRTPRLVIGVVPSEERVFCYDLIEMPEDALAERGTAKGGYYEVAVRRSARGMVSGDFQWPTISTFAERL